MLPHAPPAAADRVDVLPALNIHPAISGTWCFHRSKTFFMQHMSMVQDQQGSGLLVGTCSTRIGASPNFRRGVCQPLPSPCHTNQ